MTSDIIHPYYAMHATGSVYVKIISPGGQCELPPFAVVQDASTAAAM